MTLRAEVLKWEAGALPVVELRAPDVAECAAAGLTPQEALATSVRLSAQAWEVKYEGKVLAYWGHAPVSVLGNTGVAWCLSAPAADEFPTVFGRRSHSYLQYLLSIYHEVFVQVDLNYKRSRRWLRRLGFEEVSRSGRFATMRKVR